MYSKVCQTEPETAKRINYTINDLHNMRGKLTFTVSLFDVKLPINYKMRKLGEGGAKHVNARNTLYLFHVAML